MPFILFYPILKYLNGKAKAHAVVLGCITAAQKLQHFPTGLPLDWGQLQTQGEEGGIMGKLIWFLFDVKPQSQAKTYSNRN